MSEFIGGKEGELKDVALSCIGELPASECSAPTDAERLDQLLYWGDLYTAAGFPLTSRKEIDSHINEQNTHGEERASDSSK